MKLKLYNLALVGILVSAPLYPKDIVKCPDTLSVWMKYNLTYQKEKIDYWKTPEETIKDKGGDCDDFAILAQEILKDLSLEGDIIYLSKSKGKENWKIGHMICLFKNKKGEYQIFDNQYLLKHNSENAIETILHYYPEYDYIRLCTPDRYCGKRIKLKGIK